MHDDIAQVIFTREQIAARVAEMGAEITRDYASKLAAGESLLMLCILRGAAVFMADLIREIDLPVETDYMTVSSYGNQAESSGTVRVETDLKSNIEGRHVIVVEDMIDSGLTLKFLLENLQERNPASLAVAAMLKKLREDGKGASVNGDYVGFECPDDFIVGYGLDYAQQYRNLSYVGALKRDVYK